MTRRTRLNLESLEGRSLLSAIAYSLTTNQATYQSGQPIEMTFQETNESSRTISVDEGPSIDGFTVTQDGTTVWRSNAGANPMFVLLKTLPPGQSLTLTTTWDGIPTGGSSPASGQFVITNQLNPEAARATVTISGPSNVTHFPGPDAHDAQSDSGRPLRHGSDPGFPAGGHGADRGPESDIHPPGIAEDSINHRVGPRSIAHRAVDRDDSSDLPERPSGPDDGDPA